MSTVTASSSASHPLLLSSLAWLGCCSQVKSLEIDGTVCIPLSQTTRRWNECLAEDLSLFSAVLTTHFHGRSTPMCYRTKKVWVDKDLLGLGENTCQHGALSAKDCCWIGLGSQFNLLREVMS